MEIKKCKCGCYSSAKANVCCWCGSKELTFIDGVAEVKKEKENDVKLGSRVMIGFLIGIIGSILAFIINPVFLIASIIRLNNDYFSRSTKKNYIW